MEVRLDPRLLTLAAAITAASPPPQGAEHPLVSQTRKHLSGFSGHPSVQWLQSQYDATGLLGLAMQTVQLGAPPLFDPACPEGVPPFVAEHFGNVPRTDLAKALQSFWHDGGMGLLLDAQAAEWQGIASELADALDQAEVESFQRLFFGRFPYTAVAVPLWNMANCGLRGVGVATLRETYAVCLPAEPDPLQTDRVKLLILVQHEASHPVLDDIQRHAPSVPGACVFIEQMHPPRGRFAQAYGDPTFRWVETVIRASTYFYLQFIGRTAAAEQFLEAQVKNGVTALRPFVDALGPWWHERSRGNAPGFDGVIGDLPKWLLREML